MHRLGYGLIESGRFTKLDTQKIQFHHACLQVLNLFQGIAQELQGAVVMVLAPLPWIELS